jgi:hypothetical protein
LEDGVLGSGCVSIEGYGYVGVENGFRGRCDWHARREEGTTHFIISMHNYRQTPVARSPIDVILAPIFREDLAELRYG